MTIQKPSYLSPLIVISFVFALLIAIGVIGWNHNQTTNPELPSLAPPPLNTTAWHLVVLTDGEKFIGHTIAKDNLTIELGPIYQYIQPAPTDNPKREEHLERLTPGILGPNDFFSINRQNIRSDTVLSSSDPAFKTVERLQAGQSTNYGSKPSGAFSDRYYVFLLNPLPSNPGIKHYFGKILSSSASQLVIDHSYYISIQPAASSTPPNITLVKTGQKGDHLSDPLTIERKNILFTEHIYQSDRVYDAMHAYEQTH